jgi:hypothetical protein
MVICESYMFTFSVSKHMKFMIHKKGGGNLEGSGTFMSNTIIKELKISVEQG